MKSFTQTIVIILLVSFLHGQTPIKYTISFANKEHHEAEVMIQYSDLGSKPLQLRMSRTSPGRYSLHEFAKNVYNFKAFDSDGNSLSINRPDMHQWDVSGHKGNVTIKYTIFGDYCDGTYLAIDNTHAHLNIPATFAWARGLQNRPIEIEFVFPDPDWKIATQLFAANNPSLYTAPNLDYFMDSPVEISDFALREWKVSEDEKEYTFRFAAHHLGTDEELDAFVEAVKAIVDEQFYIFGEWPEFDNSSYTFIADYHPHAKGDGMEHRNSTILTSSRSIEKGHLWHLYTVSHEFFHIWNVERFRPKSIQPFNYEQTNKSGELWMAEGFTNYYGPLAALRAGALGLDVWAKYMGSQLNSFFKNPGREDKNAVEMSEYAPFADKASGLDRKNLSNTFYSYYDFGMVLALGLDLSIRSEFPNLSLDDYMKALWQKFGKNEIPYTNKDLQNVLYEVTGDRQFADSFFNNYVFGHKLMPYKDLLSRAGIVLKKKNLAEAWLGHADFSFADSQMVIDSPTIIGSPLYIAGLDYGDSIYTLDGDALQSDEELENWIESRKAGDNVQVIFKQRSIKYTKEIVLQEDPNIEFSTFENDSLEITAETSAFRESWMGSKNKKRSYNLERFCPECGRTFPFKTEECSFDKSELGLTKKK